MFLRRSSSQIDEHMIAIQCCRVSIVPRSALLRGILVTRSWVDGSEAYIFLPDTNMLYDKFPRDM